MSLNGWFHGNHWPIPAAPASKTLTAIPGVLSRTRAALGGRSIAAGGSPLPIRCASRRGRVFVPTIDRSPLPCLLPCCSASIDPLRWQHVGLKADLASASRLIF